MTRTNDICLRLNKEENEKIKENSKKFGFHSVSEYMRFVGTNTKEINIKTNPK